MRVWKCLTCGSGVRAPDRPVKLATARFCLTCSADSPTLVERVCPALDREKEQRQQAAKARADRRREQAAKRKDTKIAKARSARLVSVLYQERDGSTLSFDPVYELAQLWTAGASAGLHEDRDHYRIPKLAVRRSATKARTSGHAYWGGSGGRRIVITLGATKSATIGALLGVLAHEAAHHMSIGQHHNDVYWSTLRILVRQRWGVDVGDYDGMRNGPARQHRVEVAIDRLFSEAAHADEAHP